MVTITDTITNAEVTCDANDIADSIRPWFEDAPAEITEAIEALENAEFLLRKIGINPKEAPAMKDSCLNGASLCALALLHAKS